MYLITLLVLSISQFVWGVEITRAKDPATQKIISISDAIQSHPYLCLDCNGTLYPRLGKQLAHHFYHEAETNCHPYLNNRNGNGETTEHRSAKNKVQAILRQGKRIRVSLCPNICNSSKCYSILQKTEGDKVETEFLLEDGGIADVAVIEKTTQKVKFIIEILHTSVTYSRPEPWYEIKAEDVLNRKLSPDGTFLVEEQRRQQSLPNRSCLARTMKDRIWLAGYHPLSIKKRDTLDKILEEEWNQTKEIVEHHPEPEKLFHLDYLTALNKRYVNKRTKLELYGKYHPDQIFSYTDFTYGDNNKKGKTKEWALLWTKHYHLINKAKAYVDAERICIGCYKSLPEEMETWKILCKTCYCRRMRENNDESD